MPYSPTSDAPPLPPPHLFDRVEHLDCIQLLLDGILETANVRVANVDLQGFCGGGLGGAGRTSKCVQ